jgi:hypothetical protein
MTRKLSPIEGDCLRIFSRELVSVLQRSDYVRFPPWGRWPGATRAHEPRDQACARRSASFCSSPASIAPSLSARPSAGDIRSTTRRAWSQIRCAAALCWSQRVLPRPCGDKQLRGKALPWRRSQAHCRDDFGMLSVPDRSPTGTGREPLTPRQSPTPFHGTHGAPP